MVFLYSLYIFLFLLIFLWPTVNAFEDSQNDQSELSLDKIAGEVDNKAVDDFDLSPDSLRLVEQKKHIMQRSHLNAKVQNCIT